MTTRSSRRLPGSIFPGEFPMALFGMKASLSAAAFLLTASVAHAQAAAPAKPVCDVAESAKGNAARATLSVSLARDATPAVATTNLKNAVKLLEKPDKADDPLGDAYVLGTALSMLANQPGIGLTPKRGMVGFTTNPDAVLDIPTTLDSLFRIVETAKPNCTDLTSYWRAGQKFYLDAVNGAIAALNADKVDSAEMLARQANTLFAGSPYGVMVLGNVYLKKNDNAKAIEYWTKAAEVALKDSVYRDVRRSMLSNIGQLYMQNSMSSTASAAEKTAAARKAADAYTQLIATPGTRGAYLNSARKNLQDAYFALGDTVAAARTWEPLIANPTAYDYPDLLNSAVAAARANRTADAGKLFEATLAQNPYSRDALYNVAVTYLTLEQNDKVGPIVTRLVDVDPSNPDNYNLAARAYLSLSKEAEKAKKPALVKAYNDTTVKWFNAGNMLPSEVTFREFSPSEKQVVIGGTVLDRRDKVEVPANDTPAPKPVKGAKAKPAAKPAPKTFPPKAVTIVFSALDKTGAVVGTQTVTTKELSPSETARFSVTIPAANAVAYRYKVSE